METVKGRTLKLKDDVTLVSIDGAYALLDVDRKCYFEPDEVAYFLLKLMEEGLTYEELVAELLSEYDVSDDCAECDIDSFISELRKLGLIEMKDSAPGAQRPHKASIVKKLYAPPELVHQEELVVSVASEPPTATGPKWA